MNRQGEPGRFVSNGVNSHQNISLTFRLKETQKRGLKQLGIESIRDLLFHFPRRYFESGKETAIKNLEAGSLASVRGTIKSIKIKKTFRKKMSTSEGVVEDLTGSIRLFFFNQAYIAKMFPVGTKVRISGKVGAGKNGLSFSNPEIEKDTEPIRSDLFNNEALAASPFIMPLYPETKGVTSNFIYHAVGKLIAKGALKAVEEILPKEVLENYHLPSIEQALLYAHFPKNLKHAEAARKRFSFEEIFLIQLARQKERAQLKESEGYVIHPDRKRVAEFMRIFPFKKTKAQERAIEEILNDLEKGTPMSRLLEGDVGSGKTAVAAASMYAVVTTRPEEGKDFGNLQVAYMAPTEILARQQFENFMSYFKKERIPVGLITSSGCAKFPSKSSPNLPTPISRSQMLKWVANGEIPILVGTHSLIKKSVVFKHLGLAIIDEQHRFGTKQRKELIYREDHPKIPHLLSMTATPIPRTLALTIYGDLDLTLLDEMPAGRKPVITKFVKINKREEAYQEIRKELSVGRQAYVICPRINEPDPENEASLIAKSVKEEAKHLKKEVFPEYEIGVLHGKMKPKEKEETMSDFAGGAINILVATSLVEVGINIPNANVIIIEGAERFGLAQLHQLRGRVLRSTHQSFCYLFTESKNETALSRLNALQKSKSGFELAEEDLMLRGAGELSGDKQSGLSDLGMEAIKNLRLVEFARKEAKEIIDKDYELKNYPKLKSVLEEKEKIHME